MDEIQYDFARGKARNAEHVQLTTDLLSITTDEQAEQYNFLPQWKLYNAAANNEIGNFKPAIRYLQTEDIAASDAWRDKVFIFYKRWAGMFADYGIDDKRKKAGRALYLLFQDAGKVPSRGYAAATAILTNLVTSLGEEPYASALAAIGMQEAPAKIQKANEEFHKIYTERTMEEHDRSNTMDMKVIRNTTDEAFNTLAKTINMFYQVNKLTTQDAQTETDLKAIINRANAFLIRFRKTINASPSNNTKPGEEGSMGSETKPVERKITAFYQKSKGNEDTSLVFERNVTAVLEGTGLKLVDSPEGKKANIFLLPENGFVMPFEEGAVTVNTDTCIEFTMMYDAAEGKYHFYIETYPDGKEEPTRIEFPDEISLI